MEFQFAMKWREITMKHKMEEQQMKEKHLAQIKRISSLRLFVPFIFFFTIEEMWNLQEETMRAQEHEKNRKPEYVVRICYW